MRRGFRYPMFGALVALVLPLTGCLGAGDTQGVAPTCSDSTGRSYEGCRVFRGRLQLPHPNDLRSQWTAFQVAGLAFEASGGTGSGDGGAAAPTNKVQWRFFGGDVVAIDTGAAKRSSVPFTVVLPCALSVNLLLQVPRDGSGSLPGYQVAPMSFDTDSAGSTKRTLVPLQARDACGQKTNDWDLGLVALQLEKAQPLSAGAITLGQDNSKNPLELLDTDGDGTVDLADTDDDDDGTSDYLDQDADGDGIIDAAQSLSALPDANKDGIADLLQ